MHFRPASTAPRARAPPISPPRWLTPITGCKPTASLLPATISRRTSTRRISADGWRAAIASRRSTAGSHLTPRPQSLPRESLAAQSMADLSQRRSLGVRQL
jgi:hypothetical protein